MKQLLHSFDTGDLRLADVPVPALGAVQILVASRASVISSGTERSLIEFGRAGWIEKARSRPDQLRKVYDKIRTDGLRPTLEAVRSKLEEPIALGYCNAGVVLQCGSNAAGHFSVGDRVVTNGSHGEIVAVPHTLAARIPDNVSDEAAAFTPLAAIALQGMRMASPTLGETVVVFGLGLIGQLTVQLLRANGCRVIGIDPHPGRRGLAQQFGATVLGDSGDDVVARVVQETGGVGADAVLLTLSSVSDEPAHQAAAMSRQRGRLVLVGVTGLGLRREDFYKKELRFSVSCSYGPGRYDPSYEDHAHDYPVGFVRWTEKRNFSAVLALMSEGKLDAGALVTHRFPFDQVVPAYELIQANEPCLGVVLHYPNTTRDIEAARTIELVQLPHAPSSERCAVIGAGAYGQRVLLPAIRAAGFQIQTVATLSGRRVAGAEKLGVGSITTDVERAIADPRADSVFILTRHDSHAALAISALRNDKHVFVEKPLALDEGDLVEIAAAVQASGRLLMVGFNRRFAPLTRQLIQATVSRGGPLALVITVNAGQVDKSHWVHDADVGGGRFAGEGCHFIDLARAIVGAPIKAAACTAARTHEGSRLDDVVHVTLEFVDGSTAAIHYLATGARTFPKERIEAFVDGRTYVIDNWRRLRQFGGSRSLPRMRRQQDKGHAAELRAWFAAVNGQAPPPIPLEEILEVSHWTIRLAQNALFGGEGS